jgi:hypothetical protein
MLSWGKTQATPAEVVDVEETTTQGPYGLDVCHDGGDQAVAESVLSQILLQRTRQPRPRVISMDLNERWVDS